MNRLQPPTANQPQVNDSRIYSAKVLPTVKVKLQDSDDGRELILNETDFDAECHVRLD